MVLERQSEGGHASPRRDQETPHVRDVAITLDERFNRLVNSNARLEKLYEGCRWAEGPAYFAAGRYLVWSDIPNDRMMRFDETSGAVSVFRQPAGYSNGNTVDRQGRPRHLRAWQPARLAHGT